LQGKEIDIWNPCSLSRGQSRGSRIEESGPRRMIRLSCYCSWGGYIQGRSDFRRKVAHRVRRCAERRINRPTWFLSPFRCLGRDALNAPGVAVSSSSQSGDPTRMPSGAAVFRTRPVSCTRSPPRAAVRRASKRHWVLDEERDPRSASPKNQDVRDSSHPTSGNK
jgi:hypothetical protein